MLPHAAERVPLGVIVLYSLPAAAVNFTFMLTGVYLLKYSADVLLVAPGAMGLVYGLSRLWDAVSDPIAGHLSDRTSSRLGRRRSWLLLSALPVSAGFAMLWIPPERLSGASLVVWLVRDGKVDASRFDYAPYVSIPPGGRWSLALLYLVFALVVAVLYPICRWYAGVKQRRPGSWLRYL